jgi:hypothetical protein
LALAPVAPTSWCLTRAALPAIGLLCVVHQGELATSLNDGACATQLFVERGYAATSIDAIAQAAGVAY